MSTAPLSEKPMAQKTILILGGSYAGISSAHYFIRHVLPSLPDKESYNVTIVNPSTHMWTRPSAVRGIVSYDLVPVEKSYYDIAGGFTQYPKGQFTFLEGTATALDPAARTVTVELAGSTGQSTIIYHALVIATGTKPTSPALGIHTTAALAQEAQKAYHAALPTATSIIIGGGGPTAVETAGEIAFELNGTAGMFKSTLANPKVKITLVTSAEKLLPNLRPAIAKKAEKFLAKLGVSVIYGARIESVIPTNAGSVGTASQDLSALTSKTTVTLSNGETLDADLYIPAMGVTPNTTFVPKTLLSSNGHIENNASTLRVDAAGPMVYAVGDVATYTKGGIMDIYEAVPVALTNLRRDLLETKGGDRPYKRNDKETQLVPVGRKKGVGAIFGWKLPSFFVWMIKGRDFFSGMTPDMINGNKFAKESKWKQTAA